MNTPLTVQSLRFIGAAAIVIALLVIPIANVFVDDGGGGGGDDGSYCQRQNMNKRFLARTQALRFAQFNSQPATLSTF